MQLYVQKTEVKNRKNLSRKSSEKQNVSSGAYVDHI
jgi:hypothetical protein